ncbi:hypothetical protein DICVIV_09020 [Dictyocaulus viviparus]|uniref:Uncharacterized protein n=1 Tax=Dictyocaulus viviparus TaxID=29172 RepID=A0A0D8XMB4_DICVI|nr:hypothetical protein DICVIV_09020 [Dictyocaulus viviparus]
MLLEKRSSLKAKLLSFDDSFLQSPRNLQSAAALPLPTTSEDNECERDARGTSNDLSLLSQSFISKMDHWQLLHPPLQDFVTPSAPPLPTDPPIWTSDAWTGDLYHPPYYTPVTYHASFQSLPRPSYYDLSMADCQQWTTPGAGHTSMDNAVTLTNIEDSNQLFVKDFAHNYPFTVDYKVPIDYAMPTVLASPGNGFQLISEVTNTLLGHG